MRVPHVAGGVCLEGMRLVLGCRPTVGLQILALTTGVRIPPPHLDPSRKTGRSLKIQQDSGETRPLVGTRASSSPVGLCHGKSVRHASNHRQEGWVKRVPKIRPTKPDTQMMTPLLRSVTGSGRRSNPEAGPSLLSLSSSWPRTVDSQSANMGSNPIRDATVCLHVYSCGLE